MAQRGHPPTSILVVDHHPMWLEALRSAVSTIPGVKVDVGLLPDGFGATKDFDVVLLDPCFQGRINLSVVDHIRQRWPKARLVVFSDCIEEDEIREVMARGVQSYILKTEPVETVRASVEAVCRGTSVFSLPVAAVVAARPVPVRDPRALPGSLHKGLSPREVEVLQMIARGFTDVEMGELLAISKRTVSRHVSTILNKLGCRTRSQAVADVIGAEPPLVAASSTTRLVSYQAGDGKIEFRSGKEISRNGG